MSYIVGTLSRFPKYLLRLCESIRQAGETVPILVADDGLPKDLDLQKFAPIERVPCRRPFNFARNANVLLERTTDDVFLVNDDAQLTGHDAPLKFLEETSRTEGTGLVSAVIDGAVNNTRQKPGGDIIRNLEDTPVCFVAVYLKRPIIEAVGKLDEQFNGYGFEDDDYSLRVRKAGFSNLVDGRCIVQHKYASSSFKLIMPNRELQYFKARTIFVKKWPGERR